MDKAEEIFAEGIEDRNVKTIRQTDSRSSCHSLSITVP